MHVDPRIEDALYRAKGMPKKYFVMAGVVVVLLIVGLFVWWPKSAAKPDAKTEAAVNALKGDTEANQPPPPVVQVPSSPRRQAVPIGK